MKLRLAALTVMFGLSACADGPTEPAPVAGERPLFQPTRPKGTGLVLESVTGLTIPIIGLPLGDVIIDQAVITNFAIVENAVGAIVGLEVEGILQLTGGVLGTDVITEDFNTLVSVTSSGPGQCDLITIDLGPIAINALGLVTVDVPVASVQGRGSGAVGALLCAIGQLLSALLGGGSAPGLEGLVNALNNQI
jgi:hypothetical protein